MFPEKIEIVGGDGVDCRELYLAYKAKMVNTSQPIYETTVRRGNSLEGYTSFKKLKYQTVMGYKSPHTLLNDGEKPNAIFYEDMVGLVTYPHSNTDLYQTVFNGSMRDSAVEFHIASNSEYELARLAKIIKNTFPPAAEREPPVQDTAGSVYVITTSMQGYGITQLGYAEVPVEWDNYPGDVVSAMKDAIEDLSTDTPRGRMLIIEGPPGTGKTYLLRGLVNAVKNAPFVIIPANMLSSLTDPAFMTFLTNFKAQNSFEGPLVLLLEDADKCLVKRENADMSAISTMLNLSDGILGEMMDIRIVATTNAMSTEFDPAILREGRLSKHVLMFELAPAQATKVLQRLVPDSKHTIKLPTLLTSVYKQAYDLGWRPANKEQRAEKFVKRLVEAAGNKKSILQQLRESQ